MDFCTFQDAVKKTLAHSYWEMPIHTLSVDSLEARTGPSSPFLAIAGHIRASAAGPVAFDALTRAVTKSMLLAATSRPEASMLELI
jgi:hypothetical protein